MFSPVHWIWLANPILFGAWLLQLVRQSLLAAVGSFVAFMIALSFLFQTGVVTNEAGMVSPIMGYGSGYWLWLSSMVVSLFCSLATLELSGKKLMEEEG